MKDVSVKERHFSDDLIQICTSKCYILKIFRRFGDGFRSKNASVETYTVAIKDIISFAHHYVYRNS